MGKKSKEARRARRDAARADEEATVDHRSVADEEKPGAERKRIIRAFQICMPAMAAETAEAVMVALINEEAHYPQGTHDEIVELFIAAGHRNAMEMKDAVYALLEYDDVLGAAHEMKVKDKGEESENAPSQETVLVARVKSRGTKAPRQQAHVEGMGQQARGQKASLTLGLALSELARQPKPRKLGSVDEIVWSEARSKAVLELQTEMQIAVPLESYYDTMCTVGKTLLAHEIQRKTQKLYDYKATKLFQKTERKLINN